MGVVQLALITIFALQKNVCEILNFERQSWNIDCGDMWIRWSMIALIPGILLVSGIMILIGHIAGNTGDRGR